MQNLVENIIAKIDELEIEFQENQALLLSEDDLKCHLFHKLYSLFEHNEETMDNGIKGSPLHSEIKFYDSNEKLKLIPDITILDTKDLSIIHSLKYKITSQGIKYKKSPSKEFEFGGNTIIIELKFCKNKNGINNKNVISYEKDINKIKSIQEIVNTRSNGRNSVIGFFVVFNKTNKQSSGFRQFIADNPNTSTLKTIYKTGNLDINLNNSRTIRF